MPKSVYKRFGLPETTHVPDAHVESIELELTRLARALDAGDEGDAIGCLKTSAEAVARTVHDLDGSPVASSANYESTVQGAHELLAKQKGLELAYELPFAVLVTQAGKIVRGLGPIRNSYGSGHGKARQPQIKGEMLDLALEGTMLWLKWAMRRLDSFAQGRPASLIRDLNGDTTSSSINFYSGDLAQRLSAANLADSDPSHARAIGVAVGQRAAGGTFNVRIDGVDPLLTDEDLQQWPAAYRLGVANGLLFDPSGIPNMDASRLHTALQICLPIEDEGADVNALVKKVISATPDGRVSGDSDSRVQLLSLLARQASKRPDDQQQAWAQLAAHLDPIDTGAA